MKIKKLFSQLKAKFTGKPVPIPTIRVGINSYSQGHVLAHYMRDESLSHDEKVITDISPVRLEQHDEKEMTLYFCPMQDLKISSKLQLGDGGRIPHGLTLKNLKVPKGTKSGLYTLKNVELHSNGTINVKATANTQWEKYSPKY